MHAFLIIGNNITQKEILSLRFRMTEGAKILEFPFQKIDDVREIGNFTKLKLTEKTAILLKDFDKAGIEAQNAFLKSLEEPQENLFYILTATNSENVLPTIISRCEVVEVKSDGEEKISKACRFAIEDFINAEIGEKLNIISKINKREEAISFVNDLIIVSHELMLKNPNTKYQISNEALRLKANLEANGNVQLQLTNFVVSLN